MNEICNKYCVAEKTAELLEKLGFNWRYKPITVRIGNKIYNQVALNDQLPTLEEAQRWLMEVKREVIFGLQVLLSVKNSFPQVKWEDEEPTKVELTIKICK